MRIPVISGVIERRLLINYRIREGHLSDLVPPPFEPIIIDGFGVAGICLIRLGHLRPTALAGNWGVRSENAAHRVAVRLPDGTDGVYIPRRDTNSWLNVMLGGRFFPGHHHHATFTVDETDEAIAVVMESDDGQVRVSVRGQLDADLNSGSLFPDLATASKFFEKASVGYSDTTTAGRFDGLELQTNRWKVEPLAVDRVESSFFSAFAPGAVEFDCALLMRNIEHEWHPRESLEAVAESFSGT